MRKEDGWARDMLQCYTDCAETWDKMRTQMDRDGGKALRCIRRQCGLGLKRFADKLGVHFTYLSKIENGRMPLSSGLAKKVLEVAGEEKA